MNVLRSFLENSALDVNLVVKLTNIGVRCFFILSELVLVNAHIKYNIIYKSFLSVGSDSLLISLLKKSIIGFCLGVESKLCLNKNQF